MKNFFAKLGRWLWPWGLLKIVVGTVALIVFFYVEEDWRGARAWAATKAKWEAEGESFDANRLIPPPIPDAENLAALPLFAVTVDPKIGYSLPVALRKALRSDQTLNPLPSTGNW